MLRAEGSAAWTGLACAALFGARWAAKRWLGRLRFALTFAGVILLHAAWDTLSAGPGHVALGLLSFALLLTVAWRLGARQRRPSAVTKESLDR